MPSDWLGAIVSCGVKGCCECQPAAYALTANRLPVYRDDVDNFVSFINHLDNTTYKYGFYHHGTARRQRKEQENATHSKMVKTLSFGDIQVPSPGFGAMGLSFGLGSNLSYEEAEPVLLKAVDLGCTFWDTAVCPSPCVYLAEI